MYQRTENRQKSTRVGTFEVFVPTHVALRMFIMQVLASQMDFLIVSRHGVLVMRGQLCINLIHAEVVMRIVRSPIGTIVPIMRMYKRG